MGSVWLKLNNAQCFIFLRWRLCWPTLNIHKWPPFVTYWASLHWQLCLPSPQCSILWRRGDRRTIQVKQCQLPFSQPAASSHQFLELSKLPTAHISVQIKESVKDAFCFWPKLFHLIAFWLFWCQCSLEWVWQYESPRKLINWRGREERTVLTHFGMETNGLFQGNMKIYRADHLWGKYQISLFGPPHSIALASIAHKSPFLILPNLRKLRNLNEGLILFCNEYLPSEN